MVSASLVVACAPSDRRSSAPRADEAGDLLAGRLPRRVEGVRAADRLTDGIVAPSGDGWQTDRTAVFPGEGAFAEFDLGASRAIRAVYLQGDNNDRYVVEISDDGRAFHALFVGGPVARPGMQARHSARIDEARGRYVRVRAEGGDGSYSLGELSIYETVPAPFPPALVETAGEPARDVLERHLALLALAFIAFVWLARAGALWWNVALGGLLVAAALDAARTIGETWPVDGHTVSVVRALVALVALAAVLRAGFSPGRFAASPRAVGSVLAVCAFAALLAFYDLGRPQFVHHGEGRPTFVHHHDMRMYFPAAKYFSELRYDGIYEASLAALEEAGGPSLDRLGDVAYRDMATHRMVRVGERRAQIAAAKARFTEARWRSFVEDMRYFLRAMGERGYLGSMHDQGANATPAWLLFARALFAGTTASEGILLVGAGLDLALLLLAFGVVGRTYGARTMLVAMIVFGATDLVMFGSNWAGSTLRHDFMAYLALGVCALRTERFRLGGALLALAAMIRAFPALALVGAAMPAVWSVHERGRALGRFPRLHEVRAELAPLARITEGAGLAVVGLWLASSLALSFDAWPAWAEKIVALARDRHLNNVSLRQLAAWTRDAGLSEVAAGVLAVCAGLVFAAGVFVAARRARPDQAAILGLFLVPVVFDPYNYYLHLVWLFPMLTTEEGPDVRVWAALLAMCVAEYFTVGLETVAHFRYKSAVLFACLVAMLAVRLARAIPRAREALSVAGT
jgi:hypothetical protein